MPPWPSRTIPLAAGGDGAFFLRVRQAPASTVTVISGSHDSGGGAGLSSGAIVGIVLGSVIGFLLLFWCFVRCCCLPADVPPFKKSTAHRQRHHRSHDRYYVAYNGEPTLPPLTHTRSRHGRHHHRRGPSIEVYRKLGSVVKPVPVVVHSSSRGQSSRY